MRPTAPADEAAVGVHTGEQRETEPISPPNANQQ
jgi:hypothetical protein